MAKKGGVSEISGFVSVNNEDKKTNAPTKPVIKRSSTTQNKPSVGSSSKTSSVDYQKVKRKSDAELDKSKKPSQAGINKPKKPPQTDVNVSRRSTDSDPSKTQKAKTISTSRTQNVSNAQRSKLPQPNASTARKPSEVSGPNKSVTSTRSSSKVVTKDVPSKPKVEAKSKVTSNETTLVKTSRSSNVKAGHDTKMKQTVSKTKVVDNTKVSKSSDLKKLGPKAVVSKPSRTVPAVKSEQKMPGTTVKISSRVKPMPDKTEIKIVTKGKTDIVITENKQLTDEKKAMTEEVKTSTNYKDLVYFEIDMSNKKEPSSKQYKSSTENSQINSRVASGISRQGTFTKDDDDSRTDSSNLPDVTNIGKKDETENEDDDEEEYDYEDDFEDYESDFEEYVSESGVSSDSDSPTSSNNVETKPPSQKPKEVEPPKPYEKTIEEEKKMDSGNYDLTTKPVLPQSVKQKQLEQIKEAISRENSSYFFKQKAVEEPEPVVESEMVIMDFLSAFKRQNEEKAIKEKKTRSKLILEMIELHVQDISIFEQEFVYIDGFDPLYKNRNVSHASSQASVLQRHEDTQTDDIRVQDKWIQFPPSHHKLSEASNPLEVYIEDLRGYGGDKITVDVNTWMNPYYNLEKLYNFFEPVAQVVLIILEEEASWRSAGNVSVIKAKHDHGFSRGYIPIQTKSLSFLKNRPISDVLFSPHNPNIFLSSHRFVKDIENLPSLEEQFLGRSILSLWNILEPSQPLSMFVASCQVSAVSFDSVHPHLLYAGLTDGSLCLWDTSERSLNHKETLAGGLDYLLRTPTYCSSHLLGDGYHNNVIVEIQSLGYEIQEGHSREKFFPSQVVTLDADGKVIVWVTVLSSSARDKEGVIDNYDFGKSLWGNFKLVASQTLNPMKILPAAQNIWSFQFLSMGLAPQTTRSILLGTNAGSVVHCLLTEEKAKIPIYSYKEETDSTTSILSIEKSPHEFNVFLAGCSNGTVRIHVMDQKRPIKILLMDTLLRGSPIAKIRWSSLGAGLFFVLDKSLCLHIWDLCKGETTALLSLSLKKLKASHFDISSDNKYLYLALAVHKDRLEIHRLKEQFTPSDPYPNEKDKEKFAFYIDNNYY